MSDKEKKMEQTTEDKMQELFQLMDEKAAAGELVETGEDLDTKAQQPDTSPLSEGETAAYEYNMMMQQYEALLLDYQRREAEEQRERAAQEEAAAALDD